MKIAHLSDLHIGYSTGLRKTESGITVREQDGYDAFAELVEQVIQEGVDAVIVGGDIFHDPFPSIRSIIAVQQGFKRLALAGIKVYSVTGNHDTNDVARDLSAALVIHDEERGIFSHAEPYVKYEIADNVYVHMISHHMFSAQSETMKNVKPVDGAINILTTHGSVIDRILNMQLSANQSPREVVIPDFLLMDFQWDCIMLGHIHERGFVGSDKGSSIYNNAPILYNGSLIRRGFSDEEGEFGRGWTLWTIDSAGSFSYEFRNVWQRPQYDLPVIDGDETTDITEQLVANVEKAMSVHTEYNESTAPIVRQKFKNISYAQKAGISWKSIQSFKNNMLTWSESTDIKSLSLDDDNANTDNVHNVDNENNVSTSSGNLVTDFGSWVNKGDSGAGILDGLDDMKKKRVIDYSKKKVEDAYNDSLTQED